MKGRTAHNKGKSHSLESRRKMSEARKVKKVIFLAKNFLLNTAAKSLKDGKAKNTRLKPAAKSLKPVKSESPPLNRVVKCLKQVKVKTMVFMAKNIHQKHG